MMMKRELLFILLCALPFFAQTQSTRTVFNIDLAETNSNFIKEDGLLVRYLRFSVSVNTEFQIDLFHSSQEAIDLKITKFPKSSSPTIYTNKGDTTNLKKLSLKDKEEVSYWIEIPSKKLRWDVIISTESKERKNSNFIFISAIRSVAGIKPSSEIFDLNMKFNYGDKSKSFSVVGLDLSLSETDSSSGSRKMLNEAMFSINRYWMDDARFKNIEAYTRIIFYGAGLKVFDTRMYLGGHIGSIEIGGPFYSSYVIVGYYNYIFGRTVQPFDPTDKIRKPRIYQHNIYTEITFAATDLVDLPVLSNIRLKLGLMIPVAISNDAPPTADDLLTRLVLEVPIGKIFKF